MVRKRFYLRVKWTRKGAKVTNLTRLRTDCKEPSFQTGQSQSLGIIISDFEVEQLSRSNILSDVISPAESENRL